MSSVVRTAAILIFRQHGIKKYHDRAVTNGMIMIPVLRTWLNQRTHRHINGVADTDLQSSLKGSEEEMVFFWKLTNY